MRAITIQQPYAFAVASGVKTVENRTRPAPWTAAVGQRVAIHAGRRWYDGAEQDPRIIRLGRRIAAQADGGYVLGASLLGFLVPQGHVLGAVVAVGTLTHVHHAGTCSTAPDRQRPVDAEGADSPPPGICSPWAEPDAWHLVWADVQPLPQPVPARGALGLWALDDALRDQVLQQLSAVTA